MSAPDLHDLTILGAGPTGLFAAYYAGLRRMSTKIIDSLDSLGGQLTALYPEKFIFDIPGFPRILARDLARNLVEQATQANPTICLNELITTLEPITEIPDHAEQIPPPLYKLTSANSIHYTRTLLIAAGAGAFSPKKLPLPDAARFENHALFYSVPQKSLFAGKNLLIIGGGDSAIDWALNLQSTARKITLIHRRNQFRAHEDSLRQIQATPTQILPFFELDALLPSSTNDHSLTAAIIRNNQTHETRTLPVDAILVQIGFNSSLGPLKNWPLQIDRNSIPVNPEMETSLPGIFAAGDICSYPAKLKLIATGFAEALTAVNYAKTRIDPSARPFPGHSSEMTPQPQSMATLNNQESQNQNPEVRE
ncbi:MAG TPA: NAD(P)/FAD-dependent oxidoreductase [Phycisphaerae bacterium]|nr:NAD(P)/FAD-dependent oxidoreductase [Phycisphaerae bacterium]